MASDSGKGGDKGRSIPPTPSGEHKRGLRTLPSTPPTGDLKKSIGSTGDLRKSGSGTGDLKKKSRRLQMIDYPDDEPLIDHKGRSKPLYKPQTHRPANAPWRPSRLAKLLLGLFPGLRVLALVSLKEGGIYAGLGVVTLVMGALLSSKWSANVDRIQHLQLRRELLLGHAALIAATVLIFELLRLASHLAEANRGPRIPRVLATFVVPGAVVLWGSSQLVGLWPRLVEPFFLAALILTAGGLPGALWCAFDGGHLAEDQQRRLRRVSGGVLALSAGVGLALILTGSPGLADLAQSQGFQLLPVWLR